MAQILSEDGVDARRDIPDEDVIAHSSIIDTTSLEAILSAQGKTLPPQVVENLGRYRYLVLEWKLGAKLPRGYKGVRSIAVDYEIVTASQLDIEDAAPKDEWVAGNFNGDIKIGIVFKGGLQFAAAKDLPDPATNPPGPTVPGIGIDTGIRLNFSFSPKIATIRCTAAGTSGQWVFNAKPDEGVGGMHALSMIAKLDLGATRAILRIRRFRVVYKKDFAFNDTVIVEDIDIPIDLG